MSSKKPLQQRERELFQNQTTSMPAGKNNDPTDMRIVLIGGRCGGGKSSVGNIILGRDVFETNRRTSKSVMKQEKVSGRQVTVVNTPGWMSHYPLDLTPKLTQLEIQQSVNLCPPGPDVFLLVMPLNITCVGTGMSVEEHVRFLLNDQVWRHTIVVFTVNEDTVRPVKDLIRSDSELRSIIEKCEERFHVLNISDRGDGSQVTELLEKIEQMMTSNGCHYETEKHVSEELKKMERTIRRRAEQRRADAQKQATTRPKDVGRTDLRILLLGRCSSGKSSAGNIILRRSVFKVGGPRSVQCEIRHGEVAGRHLTVVESPGWFYNSPLQDTSEMDKLEIQNSVSLCPPGPHAVLLMVRADEAFTKAQRVAVEEHMTLLSQRAWSHAMVLFTHGDCLGDTSIEQYIEAEGEDLRWLVDKCGNRYHVFNNKERDGTQVTELLGKMEMMVAGNRGRHYQVGEEVSETISKRKRNIKDNVLTFMTRTHMQRYVHKPLFKGEHLPDVRVMLVGGEQNERNRVGNTILQDKVFAETPYKEFKTQKKLTECVRQRRLVGVAKRNMSVVNCPDCPDWSITPPSQKIRDVLLHGVTLCSPGPHAVLLPVSVRSSFSEAERRSIEEHMELLGDRIWRHTLVLFTWGYWLGERRVVEYIGSEGEPLSWLLKKCGYRYHVLQFSKRDISEVTQLMEKIEDMVMMNQRRFGTLDSREGRSVRDTGHFSLGKSFYSTAEWNRREQEWKKREEEWRKEPTLPRMSGGTPSEAGSSYCWSPVKVSDWLKRYPGPVASSSGYESMSEVPTQEDADVMSDFSVNSSSEGEEEEEEEEIEDSEGWMRMMKLESSEEELKKPDLDHNDNDEVNLGSHCEKCPHVQQSYDKKIIPEKLSRGRLQAQLEGEGTYECVSTGLIFEASERVLVLYSVLSWSKFSEFLQSPWMIAGPIFNIQAVDKDPSALKSIQLPHSLCLAGQGKERVFGALHVTGKNPVIERVQYSGSHLKWSVSSLSPVGSIARDTQQDEHHGAVLVYEDLLSSIDSHTFRFYITSCNSSHIKDIKKKLKKGRFSAVDKNTFCLLVEQKYRLMSEPSGEIDPECLPFTLKSTELRGFFEAYYEQPPPFKFNLKASGTDVPAWTATIRQGDLVGSTEKSPSRMQLLLGQLQLGSSKGKTIRKQRSDAFDEGASKRRSLMPDMKADFVKKNWSDLIQRVRGVLRVADDLLEKNILTNEIYNEIKVAKTSQDQMRVLLDIICPKGKRAMSAFYDALRKHDWLLVEDLEEDQGR